MDKTFENMFLKRPDDISTGYYFYNVEDDVYKKQNKPKKHNSDLNNQDYSKDFKYSWNCRKLQEVFGVTVDLEKVISEIAGENKPFLEISCGSCMGLTPFILKRNPEIQCLVTDINDDIIYEWRKFIDDPENKLERHRISLARFDNCDMPINNESFDYITCTFAINYLYKESLDSFKKALTEIHRVLKKGGRLVSIEHARKLEFDMEKIDQECQKGGAFYGLYPYEILKQAQINIENDYILEKQIKRDQLISTGFKIDVYDDDDKNILIEKNPLYYVFEEAEKIYSVCANCNTVEERNEKCNKKEDLEKTINYTGVKFTMEKYLLVVHKL